VRKIKSFYKIKLERKKMRLNVFGILVSVSLIIASCQSGSSPKLVENQGTDNLNEVIAHIVQAEEVIQTSNYTYMNVSEGDVGYWIAVTKMDAEEGQIYYFLEAMKMRNFESKELERTFDSIFFIQDISDRPIAPPVKVPAGEVRGERPKLEQKEISVEKAEGGITIAELYANKNSYVEMKVKIRGEVVKVNPDIMGINWVHIQDGTNDEGNFDLTVTTHDKLEVGAVVTLEGLISVDRDFGAGYKYDVIMEDARQPDLEY